MPIEFPCSNCARQLRAPDGSSGKLCRCPACGTHSTIPNPPSPIRAPVNQASKPRVEDAPLDPNRIRIACPNCKHELECNRQLVGAKGQCKKCQHVFVISDKPTVAKAVSLDMVFTCPSCGQLFEGKEEMRGRKGKCHQCGEVFFIEPEAVERKPTPSPPRQDPPKPVPRPVEPPKPPKLLASMDPLEPLDSLDPPQAPKPIKPPQPPKPVQPSKPPQPPQKMSSSPTPWRESTTPASQKASSKQGQDDLFGDLDPLSDDPLSDDLLSDDPLGLTQSAFSSGGLGGGSNLSPSAFSNPYQAPIASAGAAPSAGSGSLPSGRAPVIYIIPASIMLGFGCLGLLNAMWSGLRIVLMLAGVISSRSPLGDSYLLITFVVFLSSLCFSLAIIIGSVGMIRLRKRHSAIMAAVCTLFPCSLACLAMPVGIWALVLLLSRQAEQDFKS